MTLAQIHKTIYGTPNSARVGGATVFCAYDRQHSKISLEDMIPVRCELGSQNTNWCYKKSCEFVLT